MAAATIKYTVKSPTITSSGSGPLGANWAHMLAYFPDAEAREVALAEAQATHARLVIWEAEQAAKKTAH